MSKKFSIDPKLMELVEGIDISSDHQEEEKLEKKVEPFDPEPIITYVQRKVDEDEKAIVHLHTMIGFGLVRVFGGKKTWESIYRRIRNDTCRMTLQSAVDFFSVKIGRQNIRDTVTVPRLMQSFPKLTWDMHCHLVRDGKYVEKVERVGYIGGLPMCLRYSGSPGVMGPDVWDTYRSEYFSFALALGRLWKQTPEEIIRYAENSYECLTINPEWRITMAMVNEAEALIEEAKKALIEKAKKKRVQDFLQMTFDFDFEQLRGRRPNTFAPLSDEKEAEKAKKKMQDFCKMIFDFDFEQLRGRPNIFARLSHDDDDDEWE